MRRKFNQRWHLVLLATIATVIVLAASSATFAQKSLNAKYPKPNFSAMEKYWEIISYEYDFTGNGTPKFTVLVKKKVEQAPRVWYVTWTDGDGVRVGQGALSYDPMNQVKVGENTRATGLAPWKDVMGKVKKVVVTEAEDK